ncbi:MAG TPA: tyrosine-type recombinase/integrase [Noviherbaspirillum sp.]|nr:tyrosine-type recombinase/integrase [Noviherbaspirillum sp.]
MGRKPTKNLNLPPQMRRREKASGKVYYYYDTGEKPRREIPLGGDFIAALRKYSELHQIGKPNRDIVFGDVIKKYRAEVLPTLAVNTIRVQKSDLKYLEKNFADAPLEAVKPGHVHRFLAKYKDKPTTANRCKRLFSAMWNRAREWEYTNAPNPAAGIKGHKLGKRDVYIDDAIFKAVWEAGSEPLRDAMDLAYLTGQRPADALKLTEHNIKDGHLVIKQAKTKTPLRITVVGELDMLLKRIRARKDGYKIHATTLLVNTQGKALTKAVLRNHFDDARVDAAKKHPELADDIKAFWFYDLRAKAADDTADMRGDEAASNLLGHSDVKTTKRHYLRKGQIVEPTK